MRGARSFVALCLTAALTAGCAASRTDVLVVSGHAVDALGDQFIAAAPLILAAHEQGALSDTDYQRWLTFGEKFKATYHLAVQLWIAAADTRDAQMVEQVSAIIGALSMELATFTTLLHGGPPP
jgi:hypothetical protein